ncbi:MAG: NAD+ synthase [Candidatus Altiarchaeota archaeon]
MKIGLAQLNPTVGDLDGNLAKMGAALEKSSGADLVVFPELFLTGYPPKDLLQNKGFFKRSQKAVREALRLTAKTEKHILFGAPVSVDGSLYNGAILAGKGRLVFVQHKSLLPTYDVFDEGRYFSSAKKISTVRLGGEILGISICEDAWNAPPVSKARRYPVDPITVLALAGATLLINLSASPFQLGKEEIRVKTLGAHARRHGIPFVYVNQVGANDELVFDGRSMAFDPKGRPTFVSPPFVECVRLIDTSAAGRPSIHVPQDRITSLRQALVLGIRDYMSKCGFRQAVLGLSGGVDSAVSAVLAAEAAGAGNVLGVAMPGPYSSKGSLTDAQNLAENLGIHFMVVPIGGAFDAYLESLAPAFEGLHSDHAEENIQARIRGNILMALSNKFGHLVLSTGNKSELSVGYCTLYGDMSGGLAAISDVPKTLIYELARNINRGRTIIPASSITKPPSAELRSNQTDQDSLPPYEVLDRILSHYIDEGLGRDEIVRKRLSAKTVDWVLKTVNANEYKRRQAAPGIKVTSKAFGSGRRMPIAARYSL